MPDVVIVDYGLCNLFNVQRMVESLGVTALVSSQAQDVLSAPRLVLPGVGAFGEGMKGLRARNLEEPIREYARSDRPLLGICLGAQLLLSRSEEHGSHQGLDLIPGVVVKLRSPGEGCEAYKVPQIGWNKLERPDYASAGLWEETILRGLGEEPFMYFLHSYIVTLQRHKDAIALTEYGHDRFCSVYQTRNLIGFQPHPERSGEVGRRVFRNFLELRA